MAEVIVLLCALKRVQVLALDGGGREREVPAGYPLRHRDDVGLHAVVLVAELLSGPTKAANDLVYDQQCATLAADLGDVLDVAFRRQDDAPTGDYRLHDHTRHRLGDLPVDGAFDLPGTLHGARGPVGAVSAPVAHRRLDVEPGDNGS